MTTILLAASYCFLDCYIGGRFTVYLTCDDSINLELYIVLCWLGSERNEKRFFS